MTVRYRLLTDDVSWSISWLCGSRWLLVFGPSTEANAREYLDLLCAQAL